MQDFLLGTQMKNMTYDNWKLAGYQVKKGERACGRDTAGKPVFSRDQVMSVLDNPGTECPKCGLWGAACQCGR